MKKNSLVSVYGVLAILVVLTGNKTYAAAGAHDVGGKTPVGSKEAFSMEDCFKDIKPEDIAFLETFSGSPSTSKAKTVQELATLLNEKLVKDPRYQDKKQREAMVRFFAGSMVQQFQKDLQAKALESMDKQPSGSSDFKPDFKSDDIKLALKSINEARKNQGLGAEEQKEITEQDLEQRHANLGFAYGSLKTAGATRPNGEWNLGGAVPNLQRHLNGLTHNQIKALRSGNQSLVEDAKVSPEAMKAYASLDSFFETELDQALQKERGITKIGDQVVIRPKQVANPTFNDLKWVDKNKYYNDLKAVGPANREKGKASLYEGLVGDFQAVAQVMTKYDNPSYVSNATEAQIKTELNGLKEKIGTEGQDLGIWGKLAELKKHLGNSEIYGPLIASTEENLRRMTSDLEKAKAMGKNAIDLKGLQGTLLLIGGLWASGDDAMDSYRMMKSGSKVLGGAGLVVNLGPQMWQWGKLGWNKLSHNSADYKTREEFCRAENELAEQYMAALDQSQQSAWMFGGMVVGGKALNWGTTAAMKARGFNDLAAKFAGQNAQVAGMMLGGTAMGANSAIGSWSGYAETSDTHAAAKKAVTDLEGDLAKVKAEKAKKMAENNGEDKGEFNKEIAATQAQLDKAIMAEGDAYKKKVAALEGAGLDTVSGLWGLAAAAKQNKQANISESATYAALGHQPAGTVRENYVGLGRSYFTDPNSAAAKSAIDTAFRLKLDANSSEKLYQDVASQEKSGKISSRDVNKMAKQIQSQAMDAQFQSSSQMGRELSERAPDVGAVVNSHKVADQQTATEIADALDRSATSDKEKVKRSGPVGNQLNQINNFLQSAARYALDPAGSPAPVPPAIMAGRINSPDVMALLSAQQARVLNIRPGDDISKPDVLSLRRAAVYGGVALKNEYFPRLLQSQDALNPADNPRLGGRQIDALIGEIDREAVSQSKSLLSKVLGAPGALLRTRTTAAIGADQALQALGNMDPAKLGALARANPKALAEVAVRLAREGMNGPDASNPNAIKVKIARALEAVAPSQGKTAKAILAEAKKAMSNHRTDGVESFTAARDSILQGFTPIERPGQSRKLSAQIEGDNTFYEVNEEVLRATLNSKAFLDYVKNNPGVNHRNLVDIVVAGIAVDPMGAAPRFLSSLFNGASDFGPASAAGLKNFLAKVASETHAEIKKAGTSPQQAEQILRDAKRRNLDEFNRGRAKLAIDAELSKAIREDLAKKLKRSPSSDEFAVAFRDAQRKGTHANKIEQEITRRSNEEAKKHTEEMCGCVGGC